MICMMELHSLTDNEVVIEYIELMICMIVLHSRSFFDMLIKKLCNTESTLHCYVMQVENYSTNNDNDNNDCN